MTTTVLNDKALERKVNSIPAKRTEPDSLVQIHHDVPAMQEYDRLNRTLNQDPPKAWVKYHPTVKKEVMIEGKKEKVPLEYIPVGRIEMMLKQVFGTFHVEIKREGQIANSVYVTVTLVVPHPIYPGQFIRQDGIGAMALQTDSGAGAIEWDKIKASAVQIALPAAESYAVKDAAEKLGAIFGSNLNRADEIAFQPVYGQPVELDDLIFLLEIKKDSLTKIELEAANRIIDNKETNAYHKLHKQLSSK